MGALIELVCTGAELLNGRSVNTHAKRLARGLAPLGLRLSRECTVPDDIAVIADVVREAIRRADVVLVSGGLGPTVDDCTREALAEVFGCGMHEDPGVMESLRRRYDRMARPLTGSRRRQALVLEGAQVLPNPAGAAPGQRLDTPRGALFVLPGPPNEFGAVLETCVCPWVRAHCAPDDVEEAILMVAGVGESDIVDRIAAVGSCGEELDLAYCASPGCVEVRVSGPAARREAVRRAADELCALLGDAVYARSREDLVEAVARRLTASDRTMATAESCTGGLLGGRLTERAGSSAFYRGGMVAYADAVKTALLGVREETLSQFGAVSVETACAMAVGARTTFRADMAAAITGIAGPDGGTDQKPVGCVCIGLSDAAGTVGHRLQFGRDRALNREWAVQRALDFVRRRLDGLPILGS